jgi:hypothetical protein
MDGKASDTSTEDRYAWRGTYKNTALESRSGIICTIDSIAKKLCMN